MRVVRHVQSAEVQQLFHSMTLYVKSDNVYVGKCEQKHLTSKIVTIGSVDENKEKVERKTYTEMVGKTRTVAD